MAGQDQRLKSVLITGCSEGGLGAALAFAFQKRNYLVIATARNLAKIPPSLTSLPNVETVQLDVTADASVKAAVNSVIEILGNKGLDVLFNNSGLGYTFALLDIDIDAARALYDVNFWGVIRTTQAFAPLVIQAKGTIVNQSSISAAIWEPFGSIYTSSKAALTSASETWRLELEPLGVRVITLMTGIVKSNFFGDTGDWKLPETSYYLPIEQVIRKRAQGQLHPAFMEANAYAERVVSDIDGGKSGKIWRGFLSTRIWIASTFLPTWLVDYILGGTMPELKKMGGM